MTEKIDLLWQRAQANDHKIIACVVPRGKGEIIINLLMDDAGIIDITISGSRGFSERGLAIKEVDYVTILLEASTAEDVFLKLYETLNIATEHGSLIYQANSNGDYGFSLPPAA